MNRSDFQQLLLRATDKVVAFTRSFVWNSIPDRVQYRIFPNQSYDLDLEGRSLTDYPGDTLSPGESHVFSNPDDVVDFLWRDGRIPEWINVLIETATDEVTTVDLECCGRFTADDERLYYTTVKMGPFGVKGPSLPPGWKADRPNEKFDLHWNTNASDSGG